jgi:hypothetical protein
MTLPFPRTWAQIHASPWLDFIENYPDEGILIFVRYDWLPPNFPISNACHVFGERTLREALDSLRSCLWDWIRDPATGEPASATPRDWSEVN